MVVVFRSKFKFLSMTVSRYLERVFVLFLFVAKRQSTLSTERVDCLLATKRNRTKTLRKKMFAVTTSSKCTRTQHQFYFLILTFSSQVYASVHDTDSCANSSCLLLLLVNFALHCLKQLLQKSSSDTVLHL